MYMDPIERAEIIAAGYDPDDPEVITALDLVRWELSLLRGDEGRSSR